MDAITNTQIVQYTVLKETVLDNYNHKFNHDQYDYICISPILTLILYLQYAITIGTVCGIMLTSKF